jgi:hypothetical protein
LPIKYDRWEVALSDGTVAVLLRDRVEARPVPDDAGRQVVFYTLDEIAIMLANYREVIKVKEAFPGSTVEAIRRTIGDPLDGIRDGKRLEDTFNDPIPPMGG